MNNASVKKVYYDEKFSLFDEQNNFINKTVSHSIETN